MTDWDKAVWGVLLTIIGREIGTGRIHTPFDFIAVPMWLIGMYLMASAVMKEINKNRKEKGKEKDEPQNKKDG